MVSVIVVVVGGHPRRGFRFPVTLFAFYLIVVIVPASTGKGSGTSWAVCLVVFLAFRRRTSAHASPNKGGGGNITTATDGFLLPVVTADFVALLMALGRTTVTWPFGLATIATAISATFCDARFVRPDDSGRPVNLLSKCSKGQA